MPKIEALLKEETSKIVRKEVQDQVRELKKTVSGQSATLARLEKKVGPAKAKTKARTKTKTATHLIAVPAGQGDDDRAFVESVIKDSLEHMTRAIRVIKDTRTSGRKTNVLKGDTPAKVQGILDKVANAVQAQSSFLKQELDHYQNGLEWDKLCVVIYGPTNSGKSTIIEALSRGDGQTIGTGEKDYTLTSREIPFGPLLLVDTPGIEGSEGKLRLLTQSAVRKAHVVLVVTTSKEPEVGVLGKVAEDAQRAGEILSILNVRGRPTAYKRQTCLGTQTPELEERIRLAMARVFADRYTEHLNLNAYLAFVAAHGVSGFSLKQYQRDRDRTTEIFGSIDKATTFSGIDQLVSKFDELTREAQPRILWGNGFKAITVLGDVRSNFSKAASSLDDAAKLWNKAIRDAKAESILAIKRSRARAGQKISSRLSRLSNELKATFQDGVASRLSSSTLKHKFQSAIKSAIPDLRAIIDEELNALREDLKVEMSRLHERMNIRLFVTDFDLPDMDEILRDISLSFSKEVVDVILSVLSIILLALTNTIVVIVAGIVAVLGKIWKWFGGGKRKRERKARTEAGRLIDREMNKVRKKLKDKLDEGWDKLEKQVLSHINNAEQQVSAFQGASNSLKEEAITLDIAATRLATRFLQADDSIPEGDLLIPVQVSEGDGIDLLVHVGKGPWELPRLPTLPKLRSYPDPSAIRRANGMTQEQRARAYIVAKRMRNSERKERTHG